MSVQTHQVFNQTKRIYNLHVPSEPRLFLHLVSEPRPGPCGWVRGPQHDERRALRLFGSVTLNKSVCQYPTKKEPVGGEQGCGDAPQHRDTRAVQEPDLLKTQSETAQDPIRLGPLAQGV